MIDPIVARPGVEHDAVDRQLVRLAARLIAELGGGVVVERMVRNLLADAGNPTRARGRVPIWRFSSSGMCDGNWSKLTPEAQRPSISPSSDDVVATPGDLRMTG
jgi:hypothetical protein